MKVLYISGEDYTALTFEQLFKGTKVKDVIENLDFYEKSFLEKDPYYDYINLTVEDLVIDANTIYSLSSNGLLDYDNCKTTNIYLETQTFT